MPPTDSFDPIDRLRTLLRHDEAVQDQLAPLSTIEEFTTAAIARAATHGIMLDRDALEGALTPDPIGLGRWSGGEPTMSGYPTRQWLPTGLVPSSQGAAVSWMHFAGEPLRDSFFEVSTRRAAALPLNRLLQERSTLQSVIDAPLPDDGLMPDGFIFHMSRCGSTLAAQMIAALPGAIVPSEAMPINLAAQLNHDIPGLPHDIHARVLRAMVMALGRNRTGTARHYVIKLDAWHMMALPLFRAAFPDTPWAFMYRDPGEVLVSQKRQNGVISLPGEAPPETFGLEGNGDDSTLAYGANVLGRICQAAADGLVGGGGILINYNEMPDAVPQRMLAHFGIAANVAGYEAMRVATRFDAKSAQQTFTPDSVTKRAEATPDLLALVDQYMAAPYAALEALRLG